jgi:hypothetical protein
MTTPTQRTLAWLRKAGYTAGVVERRIPYQHTTIDLFGFIDIVAVRDLTVGVQATSGSNLASRITKAKALPGFAAWIQAGNEAWFVGWRKVGPRGKVKRWKPRVVSIGKAGESVWDMEVSP